jgi:hypothetical protein
MRTSKDLTRIAAARPRARLIFLAVLVFLAGVAFGAFVSGPKRIIRPIFIPEHSAMWGATEPAFRCCYPLAEHRRPDRVSL